MDEKRIFVSWMIGKPSFPIPYASMPCLQLTRQSSFPSHPPHLQSVCAMARAVVTRNGCGPRAVGLSRNRMAWHGPRRGPRPDGRTCRLEINAQYDSKAARPAGTGQAMAFCRPGPIRVKTCINHYTRYEHTGRACASRPGRPHWREGPCGQGGRASQGPSVRAAPAVPG